MISCEILTFQVQCHVIYGSNMGRDLQNMLEMDDLLVVLSSKHGPGCIIEFISQTLRLLKLEESRRNMLVITSSIIKTMKLTFYLERLSHFNLLVQRKLLVI